MLGVLLYVYLLTFTITSSAHGCSTLDGFAAANPNCTVDSSCLHIECTGPNSQVASLTVSNCEDPVRLSFFVSTSSHRCVRTYSISGEGERGDMILGGQLQLNASFSRNASHLQFHAFFVGPGQIGSLIPNVTIPLSPATCMCSSIKNTTDSFYVPLPHTCLSDTRCNGFHCNITYSQSIFDSHYIIDPCEETLEISIRDGSRNLFDKVLNQSQTLQVPLGLISAQLHVVLIHYNYSVQLSVVMNYGENITILPLQQIILDRSSCDPFIPFDAAPVPNDHRVTKPICVNGTEPTTSTEPTTFTQPSQSGVSLAVVVTVPFICIILLGGCVFVIVIISVLLFYHHKRKRTVRFQRMAFDEVSNDD